MEREEVLETCEARGKILLDIGAGPLAIIAACKYNCQVVNIDIDQELLLREREEAIRKGIAENIIFVRADATSLPFQNNSFDITISYGALHHVPVHRREAFILEVFRVTREKFCIAEYYRSTIPHDEAEFTPVDLAWLESVLGSLGKIKVHHDSEMVLYICSKESTDW